MDVNYQKSIIKDEACDVIILGISKDNLKLHLTGNERLNAYCNDFFGTKDFKGKLNETVLLYPENAMVSRRILLVGLGEIEKYDLEKIRLETIVFVGKGITFDSGGISLKSSDKMNEMKFDMSGGAAVIGALKAIAQLDIPLHVVGLIPATENLPSGSSMKPGDILRTGSGKTIEVVNTDAEGRLILADALTYAKKYKAKAVVDIATLTGACVIALGHYATGLFSKDENLSNRLKKAGEKTGERLWELPLWDEYTEDIKSDYADVRNSSGRWGAAITAAAFLSQFAEDYPWAHLDIAGTAWTDKESAYIPKGGTGIGVRMLVQFLRDWRKNI